MEKTNNNFLGKTMMVGATITAVAIATLGTYFLYGSKDAKKNRKQVKAWSLKAKGEILEQIENLSEVTEEVYDNIVKEVIDKYQNLKKLEKNEVAEFVEELKSHWRNIVKEIGTSSKKVKKVDK